MNTQSQKQRQLIAWKITRLLERAEKKADRTLSTDSAPFTWMERLITWVLAKLEKQVERLVVTKVEPMLQKIAHQWQPPQK